MKDGGRMRVWSSFEHCPSWPRIATIGTFDGVHRGHQRLLEATVERAREVGLPAIAVTFEPIPASVLRPDAFNGRICSPEQKLALLEELRLDETLILRFDRALAQKSPEEFMELIVDHAAPRELWVGEAFALGKHRAGDVPRLREIGEARGFAVHAVPRLTDQDDVISSSAIRAAIAAGAAGQAARLLGRPFHISGEVIHGAHLGRTIGYPTANVLPPAALVPLADGIYVSLATIAGESRPRPSMTYVGTRPTVNTGQRLIETHLLDFDGDLYGQVIGVDVLERIRGDEAFISVDALIERLRRDGAATRAFLQERGLWDEQVN